MRRFRTAGFDDSTLDLLAPTLALRNAINAGLVGGPRVYSSGKSIATAGGHADPTNGRSAALMGTPAIDAFAHRRMDCPMFIIIGGDGREYGPVTVPQVRAWIEAGRANLDTKAKALGSEEWRRLGDYAEFAGPVAPPPMLGEVGAAPAGRPCGVPVGGGFTAPVAGAGELAGIGARTGAALCNALVYFLSMAPGSLLMIRALFEQNPQLAQGGIPRAEDLDLTGTLENAAWVWAGLLGAWVLQAILIAVRGQNLGKLLVGVRVVRADTGSPVGFGRGVMLRFALPVGLIFLLNLLPPLGFLFLLVDYCFMFREDRCCLHDLIAGTRVVRA